jgi:transcriptional regulator with XRE-family HTH domain
MLTQSDLPQAIKTRGDNATFLWFIRAEMGLSQTEMAELLGLSSYTYISNLESGRQNFSDTLVKCMKYVYALFLHEVSLDDVNKNIFKCMDDEANEEGLW